MRSASPSPDPHQQLPPPNSTGRHCSYVKCSPQPQLSGVPGSPSAAQLSRMPSTQFPFSMRLHLQAHTPAQEVGPTPGERGSLGPAQGQPSPQGDSPGQGTPPLSHRDARPVSTSSPQPSQPHQLFSSPLPQAVAQSPGGVQPPTTPAGAPSTAQGKVAAGDITATPTEPPWLSSRGSHPLQALHMALQRQSHSSTPALNMQQQTALHFWLRQEYRDQVRTAATWTCCHQAVLHLSPRSPESVLWPSRL